MQIFHLIHKSRSYLVSVKITRFRRTMESKNGEETLFVDFVHDAMQNAPSGEFFECLQFEIVQKVTAPEAARAWGMIRL